MFIKTAGVLLGFFLFQAGSIILASSPDIFINFDNLSGGSSLETGDIVTNQYASLGVTFVNPDFFSRANHSIVSLVPGHSDPNILFVTQHDGFNGAPITTYGRPLQIIFSSAMFDVKMLFETSDSDRITMSAFSLDGVALSTINMQGSTNDPQHLIPRVGTIELQDARGIGRVELYARVGTGSITDKARNFGIDNLDLIPVPEPSTIALLSLGAIGLLFARRRLAG